MNQIRQATQLVVVEDLVTVPIFSRTSEIEIVTLIEARPRFVANGKGMPFHLDARVIEDLPPMLQNEIKVTGKEERNLLMRLAQYRHGA